MVHTPAHEVRHRGHAVPALFEGLQDCFCGCLQGLALPASVHRGVAPHCCLQGPCLADQGCFCCRLQMLSVPASAHCRASPVAACSGLSALRFCTYCCLQGPYLADHQLLLSLPAEAISPSHSALRCLTCFSLQGPFLADHRLLLSLPAICLTLSALQDCCCCWLQGAFLPAWPTAVPLSLWT